MTYMDVELEPDTSLPLFHPGAITGIRLDNNLMSPVGPYKNKPHKDLLRRSSQIRSGVVSPASLGEQILDDTLLKQVPLDASDEHRDNPILTVPPAIGYQDWFHACEVLQPLPLLIGELAEGQKFGRQS